MTSTLAPTSIARPRPHRGTARAAGDEASCRRRSASIEIDALPISNARPNPRRRASKPLDGLPPPNAQRKDAASNPKALPRFPHSA